MKLTNNIQWTDIQLVLKHPDREPTTALDPSAEGRGSRRRVLRVQKIQNLGAMGLSRHETQPLSQVWVCLLGKVACRWSGK